MTEKPYTAKSFGGAISKFAEASRNKTMKTYKITFYEEVTAETEEQCYEELLRYLRDCVENEDVSGFEFVNLKTQPYPEP